MEQPPSPWCVVFQPKAQFTTLGAAPWIWNFHYGWDTLLAVDPAGIQALLDAHQLFTQCGQRLVLGEPSPMVRGLLEATGLERAIPIFASVAEALASFRSPAAT
jgi:hypothetical protein